MSSAGISSCNPSLNINDSAVYPPGFRVVMMGTVLSLRLTMNISMLSLLSFPELENLGIEKKNFDCAVVVSRYSEVGTDDVGVGLGVVAFGGAVNPRAGFG